MTAADFLNRILERKRWEVEKAAAKIPERDLRDRAENGKDRRSLLAKLSTPGPAGVNIIAEIKRASPSKGPIREDLVPESLAQAYEKGGAAAISVLTDNHFFHGCPADLKKARAAVNLPVLRKDFLISFYQIYESVVMGADAALLIARALPKSFLAEALSLCEELELDALVEVHSEKELETASRAGARLIGINNRDLTTFKTDIHTSIRISRQFDQGQVAVAERGIKDRTDVQTLYDAGLWNFLIGESLVREENPEVFLKHLLGE